MKQQYAVFVEYAGKTYRYFNKDNNRNLWAKSTAQRHVRNNTHLPHQVARLVPEAELSKWIVGGSNE